MDTYNNNNLFKIINKEREINKQNTSTNKKLDTYHPIKKIPFNFYDYLSFIICKKRNKILIYEEFRRKVLSEEHIIQNYLDIYKLLNISESQNEDVIIKSKYRMSRVLSSVDKEFISK